MTGASTSRTSSQGLLDPTSAPVTKAFQLPERPASLGGKTVGILVHNKWHAPIFFRFVEKKLRERYNVKAVIWGNKEFTSKPAPAELVDELARHCDVAITGTGD
jgi:hypothetical protein